LRETLTPELVGSDVTVSQPEDAQVRIELTSPNRQLLWHLSNRPGLILQEDADNDLATSANGTGPYAVDDWNAGESVSLTANDEYWGPAATLDTVTFRFISDGRAAVTALHNGELDVHTALLPSFRPEFTNSNEFTMVRARGTDVFTLAFNSAYEPLNDPRVRTALSLAINSDPIIEAQNGDGQPLGGPITELEPGYEDLTGIKSYNPDAARELLAEAEQPNLSLTLTTPNMYDQAALDLITSQLKDVGVAVKVKPVEFVTWLEEVHTNHDYQLSYVDQARARDFGNYADPEYYFGYDNARVQALYAESLAAPTAEDEKRLLADAARQVAEDAPAKWLYNYTPTNVVGNHVEGFPDANTNSRINLEGVRIP
ncbi:MAG: ABC transporter substrate-binding protein, partial [Leucobacter sp.]